MTDAPPPRRPPVLPVLLTGIVAGAAWVGIRRWLYDNSWTLDLWLGVLFAVVVAVVAYLWEIRRTRESP